MINIGILTYHKADNCGALLQTYALQQTLCKINNDTQTVCIIDYECKGIKNANKRFPFTLGEDSWMQLARALLKFPYSHHRKKIFFCFRQKYLLLSDKNYDRDTIHEAERDFDVFIVGSDQVWNYDLSKKDSVYFLSFVRDNNKKVSFAASFGSEKSFVENEYIYMEYLKHFRAVSLRERIGETAFEKNNIKVQYHLDPVFLLDKNEWISIINAMEHSPKKQDRPYILFYEVAPQKKLLKHAKICAKKLKCDIVCVSERLHYYTGVKRFINVHPVTLLDLILRATYVYTTSFHGAAFSILLEKSFCVEHNNRISQLLKVFNLDKPNTTVETNICDVLDADWDNVQKIISKKRQKSIEYLSDAIH